MHTMIRSVAFLLAITVAPAILWAGEGKIRHSPNAIKGEYIVVLNDETPRNEVPAIAHRLAAASGGSLQRVWQDALKGCFIKMTEGQARGLSHHPDIKYIEENAEMFLSATDLTKRDPACDPTPGDDCSTTDNRLWHLDMLDQNAAVGTGDYAYCETGSGVYVYVIDLGVMRAHREFNNDANKVLDGYDASGDPPGFPAYDPCRGPGLEVQPPSGQASPAGVRDSDHGTGVASLVAGRFVGVARDAKIVPIKVSPCASNGARKFNIDTYNTAYALNEIVYANSTYYKVVQGGTTGPSGTYPHSNWPWPPNTSHYQTWGTVQLAYYGNLPTTMTVQMTIEGLDWILRPVSQGGNPNPKSPAVVTLSTYRTVGEDGVTNIPAGSTLSLEQAIGNLLRYNNGQGITVIASANNQDANACDTSPGRMSRNNPNNPNNALQPYKVITAGGTMLRNNPDYNPATGGSFVNQGEPGYDATKPTLLARWRCHAGDSATCSGNIYGTPPAVAPNPITDRSQYIHTTLGSNGGQCVTLFAPAKNIPVANLDDYNTYRDSRATGGGASGTSWSAPIVAAMAARILQSNTTYTVDQVYAALMARTSPDLDPNELDPPGLTGTPNAVLRLTPVSVTALPLTTTVATSGNTSITVSATGPGTLTYELYQVNASFDVATYHNNAAASVKTQGPQTSSTFSVASTAGTSYLVRVRSTCGTADTNITTLSSSIAAPAGVVASATAGTVTITWNSVTNATGYQVERKIGTNAWAIAVTVTSGSQTSTTDTPTVPSGVVLYRVRSKQGSVVSDPSNHDVAYTKTFTNDPIATSAPLTEIAAVHVIELRQAVNGLLELSNSSPVYVGNDLNASILRTQLIDNAHFTSLMSSLNTARTASGIGLAAVGFQVPPVDGVLMDDSQMADLRAGFK